MLFFLGRKPTHDSSGDPLLAFWGAAVFRSIPWLLLLPLTLAELRRGWRRPDTAGRSTVLLWVWLAAIMGFFSCTPERLEHYGIPTLPVIALLAARGWQRLQAETRARPWATVGGIGVLLAAVGVAGAVVGPGLLAHRYWLEEAAGLVPLVRPAALLVAATGVLLAIAAVRRHAGLVFATLAGVMLPLCAIILHANDEVAPLFSWRSVGEVLRSRVPADTEIVFECPEEYQLVGGLAFYARRPITLLEPPHFTPPTYLEAEAPIFLPRAEFDRRWRGGLPLVLVTDPLQRRDTPEGIVPPPYSVLARFGDRWVLSNVAAPAG